ncbi:hypothetical protein Tco_0528445 [Tanacetum coccineum]
MNNQTAESTYFLSPRQMALWKSQLKDHASDWLRVVPISSLGRTMNSKTYLCMLCYRLCVPLFSVLKPCSTCSKVFAEDIYGDHAVSCDGIIGIKHCHNVVRDTLVDICYRSGISTDKEVDIRGLDVCMDLTGSSPLTQTGMADFVPGHAVIDATHRKRVKYETKCVAIGYGFLPFSFSFLGELEESAVTLLKRIQKFSITQDIVARVAVHIFNRIGFAIAKGMGTQTGGIHVECGRMLSDRGLRASVGLAAMAVIPNANRTPSFVIILVGPTVAGQGWLDTLCWCFVNAWFKLKAYTASSDLKVATPVKEKGHCGRLS